MFLIVLRKNTCWLEIRLGRAFSIDRQINSVSRISVCLHPPFAICPLVEGSERDTRINFTRHIALSLSFYRQVGASHFHHVIMSLFKLPYNEKYYVFETSTTNLLEIDFVSLATKKEVKKNVLRFSSKENKNQILRKTKYGEYKLNISIKWVMKNFQSINY